MKTTPRLLILLGVACAAAVATPAASDPPRRVLRADLERALLATVTTPQERAAVLRKLLTLPLETLAHDGREERFESSPEDALSCASPCTSGTLEAMHPYYDVILNCGDGAFTARTGASHSVTALGGGPQNVIFGGDIGFPGTSDITFHVHDTGDNYVSPPGGQTCMFNPRDTPREPASIGLEQEWTVSPVAGMDLLFREEIVAFGSVEADSGIRITLGATNLPSSTLPARIGVRWQTDYQNSRDDGPLYAPVSCSPFSVGTELRLEHELLPGEILDFFRIQNNEAPPIFANYTSTFPVAGFPDTRTPDRLVFGEWSRLAGTGWNYVTAEGSCCPDDDSATLYYIGYLPADGINLLPNETFSRSFVIFTAAASQSCGAFALSVEYGSIAAERTARGARIRWTTLDERDSSFYLVYRTNAPDGTGTPVVVGQVDAHGRAGSYELEDPAGAASGPFYFVEEHTSSGAGDRSTVTPLVSGAGEGEGERRVSGSRARARASRGR